MKTLLALTLVLLLASAGCAETGPQYDVAVAVDGNGSVSGAGVYKDGSLVGLSAEPEPGYEFAGWYEDEQLFSEQSVVEFTAGSDRELVARFDPRQFVIDLEIAPYVGTVSGAGDYAYGDFVKLKAQPAAGYDFLQWESAGEVLGAESEFEFAAAEDKKIVARFSYQGDPVYDGNNLFVPVLKTTSLGQFVPGDLVDIPSRMKQNPSANRQVRMEVLEHLEQMWEAAQVDGVTLLVNSAYRSYQTQVNLFTNYARQHGEEAANRFSARPGQSEHQLGTAVDFGGTDRDFSAGFADTEPGQWLLANAHRFGFALSYPEGSEDVSGYIYEPWHYRYIGVEAATAWEESGEVLAVFLQTEALPVLAD
ncbi:MAG: hypothetical protein FH749_02050 [Firmicutes bacterium]|nr:hypothetical protein [Bacillota bacterium]